MISRKVNFEPGIAYTPTVCIVSAIANFELCRSCRFDSPLSTPTVGDKTHQPTLFSFPQREFGKQQCRSSPFDLSGLGGGRGFTTTKREISRSASLVLLHTSREPDPLRRVLFARLTAFVFFPSSLQILPNSY